MTDTNPLEQFKNISKEESKSPSTNNSIKIDNNMVHKEKLEDNCQITHLSPSSETLYNTLKIENELSEKQDDTRLLRERRHSYVGHVNDAPEFSKDNEYIINGYRINFHTCQTILGSLCLCHNETVNVWTHLVGALFTILLIIVTGITVGPFSQKINFPWRAEIVSNNFRNYSEPFYSSLPMFHNTRIYLTYMNVNFQKTLNSTIIQPFDTINSDAVEYFLNKSILNYFTLYNTLREIDDNSIKCVSCIEDFVRNLNTIKDFLNVTLDYVSRPISYDATSIRLIEEIKSFKDIVDKTIVIISDKVKNISLIFTDIKSKNPKLKLQPIRLWKIRLLHRIVLFECLFVQMADLHPIIRSNYLPIMFVRLSFIRSI